MVARIAISSGGENDGFFLRAVFPAVLLLTLLLCSCGEDLGPAARGSFTADDYSWEENSAGLTYLRSSGDRSITHAMRFSDGTITDISTDENGNILSSTTLAYDRSSTGVQLVGCCSTCLPHFPEDIRFEDHVYSVPGPDVHATNWIAVSASEMLVSESSGLLYSYGLQSRSWTVVDVPWSSHITSMALDGSMTGTRVICGTERDGIFARNIGEVGWYSLLAPPGRIDAITVDAIGTIFAAIDGKLHQYGRYTTSWEVFPIAALTNDITTLAALDLDATRSMLLLGRRQSGLVHVLLVSSLPLQLFYPQRTVHESIIDVRSMRSSAYPSVAVGDPAILHIATQLTGTWASVPIPPTARLTSVCQSDNGGVVLLGSEDGMYRFDGSPVTRSGLDGKRVLSLYYGPDHAFYCGTTDGSYRSVDNGRQWTRVDRTPVLQHAPTGLTLLPATFSVGTRWDAGKLIIGQGGGRRLSGRVLEHFDSFAFPNGRSSFDDVVVVRYAEENTDGSRRPGEYYWIVYFARGLGPIYIEEATDDVLHARTTLLSP